MAKLTPSMRHVLENLLACREAHHGFPGGMAASGGFSGTLFGLRRRGLIDLRNQLTDAGRALPSDPVSTSNEKEGAA